MHAVTSITRAHSVVDERFGAVDVLVNNAAVVEFENDDGPSGGFFHDRRAIEW
jgi:NAD(P)-dependent dehydrogenase (short-subunit alcohol dehydrogenase family)